MLCCVCEVLHTAPGGCPLSWRRHRAIGDGGRWSPTAAPLGRFLPRLGLVGLAGGAFFIASGFGSRLVMPGLDPGIHRKEAFRSRMMDCRVVSAFTRVFRRAMPGN